MSLMLSKIHSVLIPTLMSATETTNNKFQKTWEPQTDTFQMQGSRVCQFSKGKLKLIFCWGTKNIFNLYFYLSKKPLKGQIWPNL
jgi:hypothetical protein